MTRPRSIRFDDLVDDKLCEVSNNSGISVSELVNTVLLEKLKSIPEYSTSLSDIKLRLSKRRYRKEKRSANDLRHELQNVLNAIRYSAQRSSWNNLPLNIMQMNSYIDKFEILWSDYPEVFRLELKSEHELLISLKHKSALDEYLKFKKIADFGRQNAQARKRIGYKRNK